MQQIEVFCDILQNLVSGKLKEVQTTPCPVCGGVVTVDPVKGHYECNNGCTSEQIGAVIQSAWEPRMEMQQQREKELRELQERTGEISFYELEKTEILPTQFIVKDLIPVGLTTIASRPKMGKSFLSLQLVDAIANGKDFLSFQTTVGSVLYLALEDSKGRLKDRSEKQGINFDASENARCWIHANPIMKDGTGLIADLKIHKVNYPDLKLVIIDTLQCVRTEQSKSDAYGSDYRTMNILKQFADENELAVVVIHHTRKMRNLDDPFENVSGTTGIIGACDSIIVLDKETSKDKIVNVYARGRDYEEHEFCMEMDNRCRWIKRGTLEDRREHEAQQAFLNHPLRLAILDLLKDVDQTEEKSAAQLIERSYQIGHGFKGSSKGVGSILKDERFHADLRYHDQVDIIYRPHGQKYTRYAFRKAQIPFDE